METVGKVFIRVMSALHEVRRSGLDERVFVIHVAPNLWNQMLREADADVHLIKGKFAGLDAQIDRSLDHDQIQLRYEVPA